MQICSFVLQNAKPHKSVHYVQINGEPQNVYIFHINGSTLCIYFCNQLSSFKKLKKRGRKTVAHLLPCPKKKKNHLFLLAKCQSNVQWYVNLFNLFPIEAHLDFFQFSTIPNSAIVNIVMNIGFLYFELCLPGR